jgi:endonuclease-8
MPEGDTIHRTAARMHDALAGRVPDEIATPHPRHRHERWPQRLAGRSISAVDARGKHLFVRFDGGLALHSHLRMTGAWQLARAGERWRRAPGRAWLVLRCEGWEAVEFDGPVLELMSEARTRHDPRLAALGQDVLAPEFDERRYLRALRAQDPARAIGDALLDQRTVAGIGNVWKSEACFAAAVDPWRSLRHLSDEEALAVVGRAREGMARSARDGHGARPRAVYRKGGRPCPRCGASVRSRAQGDGARMTFWCPGCQR